MEVGFVTKFCRLSYAENIMERIVFKLDPFYLVMYCVSNRFLVTLRLFL